MGIYVGYDSPTIIKYLEPNMGDQFEVRKVLMNPWMRESLTWSILRWTNLKATAVDEETINMVVPKVPNNEAWDAKLQGTEGHNETSISYVMSGAQMEQEKENRH
uniref:Uncharacterized protein n=1 Tax=Brassica oleracea var. oleracea TaxID=109376 RepID=A0A0D3ATR1_BRAOL